MKTKHTPGPWHAVDYGGWWHIQTSPYYEGIDLLDQEVTPEAEANARVAAASPDMLEALQNIENDDGSIPEPIWNMIQAAIKKATHDQES